jgi:hypothetical protein
MVENCSDKYLLSWVGSPSLTSASDEFEDLVKGLQNCGKYVWNKLSLVEHGGTGRHGNNTVATVLQSCLTGRTGRVLVPPDVSPNP